LGLPNHISLKFDGVSTYPVQYNTIQGANSSTPAPLKVANLHCLTTQKSAGVLLNVVAWFVLIL